MYVDENGEVEFNYTVLEKRGERKLQIDIDRVSESSFPVLNSNVSDQLIPAKQVRHFLKA